jgi:predicted esterase
MLVLLAGALLLQSQTELVADGYVLVERLKALDIAWIETPDPALRKAAIPHIQIAINGLAARRVSESCRALDEARYALLDRPLPASAAANLRFIPPITEPGAPVQLQLSWAYLPESRQPVAVSVGQRSVRALPGRSLTLSVRLPNAGPETALNTEGGLAVPVRLDGETRAVYVSAVKNGRARIASLSRARSSAARLLGEEMLRALEKPRSSEQDIPFLRWLNAAERLEEGKARISELDEVPLAKEGGTLLRAMLLASARSAAARGEPVVAVIAFHGAGGSENVFFEGFGRGLAVLEASRRGWMFVAPRGSPTAYEDCVRWLTSTCRFKLSRVYVLGHSMGVIPALAAVRHSPKPRAIAVFAPAVAPDPPEGVPLYVAVGSAEQKSSFEVASKLGAAARTAGGAFDVIDPAEHLMVVGDSLSAAFRFLESN